MSKILEILEVLEDEEPDCYLCVVRFDDTQPGKVEAFGVRPDSMHGLGPYVRQCLAMWEAGTPDPDGPDMSQCRRVPLAEVHQRRANAEAQARLDIIAEMQQFDQSIKDNPALSLKELSQARAALKEESKQSILAKLRNS